MQYINKYVRDNGLQNRENGRIVNLDDRLKTFLKLEDSSELTYFNLQKLVHNHFIFKQSI